MGKGVRIKLFTEYLFSMFEHHECVTHSKIEINTHNLKIALQ